MIETEIFYQFLIKQGINFFTGVPDSLLKELCYCIQKNTSDAQHIIASNEGNAIALATGHYLSYKQLPIVYMQNSGFGNAINPLLSLTSNAVYAIPMVIFVGWRGEPNIQDEPQHMLQGKIMINLLESCQIKYDILPQDIEQAQKKIISAIDHIISHPEPFVFLIKKNTFSKYESEYSITNNYKLSRSEVIKIISNQLSDDDILLGSTGKISREIYQCREKLYSSLKMDFLNIGAMGHLNQIALMLAINHPDRRVVCLEGDGSMLMHLGGLAILGSKKPKNLKHFILNNGCHESVGGQPTVCFDINITGIAKNIGYENTNLLTSKNDILYNIHDILNNEKLSLTEIRVGIESSKELMRPNNNFTKHKNRFMNYSMNYLKREFIGRNIFEKLNDILAYYKTKNIFIFTGKSSFEKQFKSLFLKMEKEYNIFYYNDFNSNFDTTTLLKAINAFSKNNCDIIIAIGGGSVMDMAKMVRLFANNSVTISELLDKKIDKLILNKQKLIVIPTTSGSGSENTKFSVLYKNEKKFSIEHDSMLPDHVILDHSLKYSIDTKNAIASGLDSFCQAIESLWAIHSDDQSKSYAIYAIQLILKYLITSINQDNIEAKDKVSLASFYAGKAINISKTTISHALSYPITKYYNIPHGISVAITIIELLKYNLSFENKSNLLDLRGVEYYNNIIKTFFKIFGVKDVTQLCNKVKCIFSSLKIYNYISCDFDVSLIVKAINQNRLKNNPLKVDNETLRKFIIESISINYHETKKLINTHNVY